MPLLSDDTRTIDLEDAGSGDVVWPLESRRSDAFAAEKLAEIAVSRLVSPDELRELGLRLMRCGSPVGWMGALLLMDSNRMSGRSRG